MLRIIIDVFAEAIYEAYKSIVSRYAHLNSNKQIRMTQLRHVDRYLLVLFSFVIWINSTAHAK